MQAPSPQHGILSEWGNLLECSIKDTHALTDKQEKGGSWEMSFRFYGKMQTRCSYGTTSKTTSNHRL